MERDTTETSIPNDIDQMFIQSQVLYDEPPPLSDEELLAAVPPEDIDYDYGYL